MSLPKTIVPILLRFAAKKSWRVVDLLPVFTENFFRVLDLDRLVEVAFTRRNERRSFSPIWDPAIVAGDGDDQWPVVLDRNRPMPGQPELRLTAKGKAEVASLQFQPEGHGEAIVPGPTPPAAGNARGSHKLFTPTEDSRTSYDKVLDWFKNNRLIVVVLILFLVIGGIGSLISNLETILKWVGYTGNAITPTDSVR